MANFKPRFPRPDFDPIFKNGKLNTDTPGSVRAILGTGVNHPTIFPTDDGFSADFWINPLAKDTDVASFFKRWAAWHIYDYLKRRREGLLSMIKSEKAWPGTTDVVMLEKQKEDLEREAKFQRKLAAECHERGDSREEKDHLNSAHIFESYLNLLKQGKTHPPSPETIELRLKHIRKIKVDREQIYNALRPETTKASRKKVRSKTRKTGTTVAVKPHRGVVR
jgi:hypothetical protein